MTEKISKFVALFIFIFYLGLSLFCQYKQQLYAQIMMATISVCALIIAVGYRLEEIIKENKK